VQLLKFLTRLQGRTCGGDAAGVCDTWILIASTIFAQAADPITLRVADSFPKGHYLVK
jgi:hypothetical protein